MPRRDGSGPSGKGVRTGRGLGNCETKSGSKTKINKGVSGVLDDVIGFGVAVFVGLVILLVTLCIVLFSWNVTMPHIFGLPEINLIQTFFLLVLLRLFFGWSVAINKNEKR